MRKRPDCGDATPEDLARALMRPTNGSPTAGRSPQSDRGTSGASPTSPAVRAAICACVSAFRTLCFPANSLT